MKTKRKTNKFNAKKTRKESRKEQRKLKKQRRHEYYTNRNKPGKYVLKSTSGDNEEQVAEKLSNDNVKETNTKAVKQENVVSVKDDTCKLVQKEKRQQLQLQKEMQKQRNKQLLQANKEEDRNIKQLEKQLKLNKRKSKSVPSSFAAEGLDYLLEVCDSENMQGVIAAEQTNETNDEFEEDFALMSGRSFEDRKKSNESLESDSVDDQSSDEDIQSNYSGDESELKGIGNNDSAEEDISNSSEDDSSDLSEELNESGDTNENAKILEMQPKQANNKKRKKLMVNQSTMKKYRKDSNTSAESDCENDLASNFDCSDERNNPLSIDKNESDTWEDIYGRLRGKDGSVLKPDEDKYVPPAARAKIENECSGDKEHTEKLNRLKKQLKGFLNRLAEANMHSISTQIEHLYMNNSRNDMNDTIVTLMLDSLGSHVLSPERLLLEHIMLVTILHANIGTEVGAHFLQTLVKKFDDLYNSEQNVENKTMDNVVIMIAQLYNFKVIHSQLLYQILSKLSNKFDEKCLDCILHILKNVGFSLRKDDPVALKTLILSLQKQAANAADEIKDNLRVKYMLDILLAIKNNNMCKIPNYDTSYSEHLKKLLKSFIRKGNYVTQLNISLDDLLKADERGKWWVVGSAWSGNILDSSQNTNTLTLRTEGFSEKLLDLAKKQRMNTDIRRSIFCIIMSAEDYLDAFEKLLHLGLKNQQEREVIHVILHCCLQEKKFNPYYAVLAEKFCEYDRKYQMTIKYSVWDKLKTLTECSTSQISNLAKLLTHLFLEKGLPISTLKIMQFSELDKITLRFIRQILLGILLSEDEENCVGVFEKLGQSNKLKMFRESLRLFVHHFMLRNLSTEAVADDQKTLLRNRADMVEKVLTINDKKMRF